MENIKELVEKSAAIFMFCIAGTLLLIQYKEQYKLISTIRVNLSKQGVLYEQPIYKIQDNKVSYKEVIAALICDLEYDVQVNRIYLQKDSFNPMEFDFSVVPNTDYIKTYEVDSSGNITKVTYNSL
ncbi:hypothetical protein GCM10023142_32260 [Anaerocolumna aminovalerica]|jgi:hypothetical protein|uniref:Uncharacterized protein n=1 Tax=Anaerocolumna aminovalerica TaxID=1527 RepID=A0A1I5GEI7_9FIRM|nr:hypothetical protein [Anaerocolumna aminovalerica]SFO34382.1 hypothetical protein SAMN04489757_11920 [Anaerocolumna aminovalerica]